MTHKKIDWRKLSAEELEAETPVKSVCIPALPADAVPVLSIADSTIAAIAAIINANPEAVPLSSTDSTIAALNAKLAATNPEAVPSILDMLSNAPHPGVIVSNEGQPAKRKRGRKSNWTTERLESAAAAYKPGKPFKAAQILFGEDPSGSQRRSVCTVLKNYGLVKSPAKK